MEKVCVLGTGSWGSALGLTLAKKGYEVSMWTLNEEQAKRINKTKENILDLYEEKSSLSREEIAKKMDEETFFNAQESLEAGFILSLIHISEPTRPY